MTFMYKREIQLLYVSFAISLFLDDFKFVHPCKGCDVRFISITRKKLKSKYKNT